MSNYGGKSLTKDDMAFHIRDHSTDGHQSNKIKTLWIIFISAVFAQPLYLSLFFCLCFSAPYLQMAITFRYDGVSKATTSFSEHIVCWGSELTIWCRSRGCCWEVGVSGGWRRTTIWALGPWSRRSFSSSSVELTTGMPLTSTSLSGRGTKRQIPFIMWLILIYKSTKRKFSLSLIQIQNVMYLTLLMETFCLNSLKMSK